MVQRGFIKSKMQQQLPASERYLRMAGRCVNQERAFDHGDACGCVDCRRIRTVRHKRRAADTSDLCLNACDLQ